MLGEWCYVSKKRPIGMIVDEATHCNSARSLASRKLYVSMETVHLYLYTLSVRPIKTVNKHSFITKFLL